MSKIFFIGAGRMATAIAGGMVRSGNFKAEDISAFDVSQVAAARFTEATGIKTSAECDFSDSDIVVFAVKPQYLDPAVKPVAAKLSGKLIISIVAGVTLAKLAAFNREARVIRVMPNTPALVGCGASAFAASSEATADDIENAKKILGSVGIVMQLRESDLDAVTALSGSGPAYVFEFIKALADGGVAEGLSRDCAELLAVQTVLGAAQMVIQTKIHPTVLKDQVTSPAGTTIRALEVLESGAFSGLVIEAVRAAAERSREFGK